MFKQMALGAAVLMTVTVVGTVHARGFLGRCVGGK